MKKIRILNVAQAAGGVDRYIRMLLKYLDKDKFENVLVCSQDFHEEDYKGLVISFEQIEMTRAIGGNDLKAIKEVRALIKKYKPDIVYIYNENSISASHNEANHEFVIKCFEKIKAFIDTSDNKEMLKPWFDNRLLYVIVTTAISGYFNPTNTEPYADKKRKYAAYLEKPIVKEALKTKNTVGIGKQREVVLFLIKHRMYLMLDMMGKIRKWQKEHR